MKYLKFFLLPLTQAHTRGTMVLKPTLKPHIINSTSEFAIDSRHPVNSSNLICL